jgi:hypothetical protein
VSYRDELSAARARVAALEGELAEERGHRKALEEKLESARRDLTRLDQTLDQTSGDAAAALARASDSKPAVRKLGRVHYHPPRTYVPLIRLLRVGLLAVWNRRPRGITRFDSDRVAVHVLRWALLPLYYAIWVPYFWLSFLLTAPLTLLLVAVGTPVLLVLVVASRFTNSADPPANESGWFHGQGAESDGAMLFAIPGFIVPFFVAYSIALDD